MRFAFALCALLAASPALAATGGELRDFCADRPGLGTPACTIDPGHAMVEIGLADWTRDDQSDARTDAVSAGDILVRFGLDARTEAQIAWTAYGHVRTRDRATGAIDRVGRTGDVLLALQHGLAGPNGPVAIKGFVTLPAGRSPVGAGDWGAGVLLPFDFDLGHGTQLAFTPEVDAAVNGSGSGRHIAFGSVVGVGMPLTRTLGGTAEFKATRDDDPAGHSTAMLASASLAYQPGKNTQLDIGTVIGVKAAPDIEFYLGVARRF